MAKVRLIAVDSGCDNHQVRGEAGELDFKTRITYDKHKDESLLGGNTFNVVHNDNKYVIGNQADLEVPETGKDTLPHFIGTLTSIALMKGDADEIILMYGESFNRYLDEKHKEKVRNLFVGKHEIEVNGKVYKFKITLCHILPEGLGHILMELSSYAGVNIAVDWGGSTVNYLKVVDGIPTNESKSFELGSHKLVAAVRDELDIANLGNQDIDMIKNWIRNGTKNRQVQEIIDNCKRDILRKLDRELGRYGINLNKMYDGVTFIGGTSEMLREQIREHYSYSEIHKDCLMANVNGFYKFGTLKYGVK